MIVFFYDATFEGLLSAVFDAYTGGVFPDALLPQALKRMTPPTINIYTRIIKTSSLAVLIGVVEVIKVGQQIIERTYGSLLIYGLLFLFFFLVCYPLSLASRRLEQQWGNAV